MLPARRRDGPTTNVRLAPSHKIEKDSGAANSIGARWNARQLVDWARPRELMRDLRHAVPLLKKLQGRKERGPAGAKHRESWRGITWAQAGMPVLLKNVVILKHWVRRFL